jgi:hypothetical protein
MAGDVTLLGFAPAAGAEALAAAMAALPGPALHQAVAGGVVAFAEAQVERPRALLLARDRARLLAALAATQRRLELGTAAGPFLPADPGAPPLPAARLPALLAPQAEALAASLAGPGGTQQWDVILRWPADPVLNAARARLAGLPRARLAEAVRAELLAARAAREAALRAGLAPRVLAIAEGAPVAEDLAAGFTVQVPRGGEAAIEAALHALPDELTEGVGADLRGPLPPLAFAAVRLMELAPEALARAWALLDLPEEMPTPRLALHWRAVAARLHPDRGGDARDFAAAEAAYRLLRGLAADGVLNRRALAARGPTLLLPEAA